MRYVIPFALAAGFVAVATPALAQDETTSDRAPFTGPRVEVVGGWDRLSGQNQGVRTSNDGFVYGLGAGYDVQFGPAIVGVEGEGTLSTDKLRRNNVFTSGDQNTLRVDRDLYVGARAGVAVAPTTLLYVKGGYTNTRLIARYTAPDGTFGRGSGTVDGWRAGAGIEHKLSMFGPGGYVKAEYRYSKYSNLNVGSINRDVGVDMNRNQIVAGVGIRF
jgi:outer membrane immunogenic protein